MSRRGRRGTDGAQDEEGFWLPPDDDADQAGFPSRSGRADRSRRRQDFTGPPWESGSWEAGTGSWQAPPEPPPPGWQGHPSGPLPAGGRRSSRDPSRSQPPSGQHPSGPLPSGPLPPLPGPDWEAEQAGGWAHDPPGDNRSPAADSPRAGRHSRGGSGYEDSQYPEEHYPADWYPGDPGSGSFPPSGGYATGGFPAAGDYATGNFPRGYGSDGYPEGDYATGGYPAAADYAGSGFGEPPYQRDYADREFLPGNTGAGGDGHPGRSGRRYRDDGGQPGYPGRDPGNDPGYPDHGGWYEDVDEEQGWADDGEAGSGFLPGLAGEGDAGPRGRRPAGARPAKRKRSGLRRVIPRVFLALLLLVVLGIAGVGYHFYRTYISPPDYSGPGTGSIVVQIKGGETATAVGQQLQRLGVVASARAFGNAAKASPQGKALEPGYYRLHKHMKASLAFALLLKPSARVEYKIVIPEGWRLSKIITTLGHKTGNLAGYQQAIKDAAKLGLPSYAKGNPEGFLFPATYTVQPGTPPRQVLREMVQRFDQEAASVKLPAVARHDQLTQHDVIVVASLIQAEGGRLQDYPKIARVIYNRLNSGMKLQLDSTVMYALHRYGIMANNQQLQVKSPYNTYLHTNLPPGPIDSPGDAAIRAALHPAAGNWLYFVTVNPKTGVTKFTSDPAVFAQLRAQLQQNLSSGK